MSLKIPKEELELMSNKDIAVLILENSKRTINTADLYKKIMKLLDLPESSFESKIAEFYTSLSTDKRFILLDNGKWDLRNRHTSDKIVKVATDDEDEEDEENETPSQVEEIDEDNYDDTDDEDYDEDTNEELKDLVVIDEDELELEE